MSKRLAIQTLMSMLFYSTADAYDHWFYYEPGKGLSGAQCQAMFDSKCESNCVSYGGCAETAWWNDSTGCYGWTYCIS